MIDNYSLFRIAVASPSDVDAEREAVKKTVAEVNTEQAYHRRIWIVVFDWDTDESATFSPPGDSKSRDGGIAVQKQSIADCDLVVGIFWKRLGKMQKIEEEFWKALDAWRQERERATA